MSLLYHKHTPSYTYFFVFEFIILEVIGIVLVELRFVLFLWLFEFYLKSTFYCRIPNNRHNQGEIKSIEIYNKKLIGILRDVAENHVGTYSYLIVGNPSNQYTQWKTNYNRKIKCFFFTKQGRFLQITIIVISIIPRPQLFGQ